MSKTKDTLRLGAARTVGIVVQLVSVPIVWDILGADLLGVCYFLIIVGRWVATLDNGFLVAWAFGGLPALVFIGSGGLFGSRGLSC